MGTKGACQRPVVTHWLDFAWDYPGFENRDAGVFLEFMAEGARRSLCVKVYDNDRQSRLGKLQEAFADALDRFEFARVGSKF